MNNYKLYVHIVPNGKRYYGITGRKKIEQRWQNGTGYNTQYFARAINKYGWDNIEHIVIYDDLTEDEAKELEQYMIQWYDTANPKYGYNISLGGEAGKHSEETKRKIGEAHIGEKNHNYGKPLSKETRQKISEAKKGKRIGKNSPVSKNIICITTNKVFYSGLEAGRYYNISNKGISKCCKGDIKYSGKLPDGTKLIWKYIDIIEL